MASLPLPALYHHPDSAPEPSAIVGTATSLPARLSALEWSIVAMAERDGLSSIRKVGRYTRALRSFFGFKQSQTLWPTNGSRRCDVRQSLPGTMVGTSRSRSSIGFFGAGYTSDQFELDPEQPGTGSRRSPAEDAPDEYGIRMCSLTVLPSAKLR